MNDYRAILIRPVGNYDFSQKTWHRVEWDGVSDMMPAVEAYYPNAIRMPGGLSVEAILPGAPWWDSRCPQRQTVAVAAK